MYIESELDEHGNPIEDWWNDGETLVACSMLGFTEEEIFEDSLSFGVPLIK